MESVWSHNTNLPSFESLKEDKKTDVLIIGGGIAGILCAYMPVSYTHLAVYKRQVFVTLRFPNLRGALLVTVMNIVLLSLSICMSL